MEIKKIQATVNGFGSWEAQNRGMLASPRRDWPEIGRAWSSDSVVSVDIDASAFIENLPWVAISQRTDGNDSVVEVALGFADSFFARKAHVEFTLCEFAGYADELADSEIFERVQMLRGRIRGRMVGDESLFGDILAAIGAKF